VACAALSATAIALASPAALAQNVLKSGPAAQVQNALLAALDNVGLRQCRPAMARLATLALDGTIGNDVLLDWDRRRKDQSAVFSLIGLEYVNGGAAMSIAVIPSANGECAVHAERISSAPFPCSVLAQQELNGFRATRLLQNMTVYLDPKDPNSTVSLVETPPGCLVIRRYVDFNWLPPNPAPAQGQR